MLFFNFKKGLYAFKAAHTGMFATLSEKIKASDAKASAFIPIFKIVSTDNTFIFFILGIFPRKFNDGNKPVRYGFLNVFFTVTCVPTNLVLILYKEIPNIDIVMHAVFSCHFALK